ncbi:hypothetical protein DQC29_21765 [Salmonella enterica subsp. enterica serovar Telelkebir]|nr:hypothetical protein [Salmonella enterica subsp. enterica serovar Telelkebir]
MAWSRGQQSNTRNNMQMRNSMDNATMQYPGDGHPINQGWFSGRIARYLDAKINAETKKPDW